MCLYYALNVTGILNWTVRQATETESQMTTVERVVACGSLSSCSVIPLKLFSMLLNRASMLSS